MIKLNKEVIAGWLVTLCETYVFGFLQILKISVESIFNVKNRQIILSDR